MLKQMVEQQVQQMFKSLSFDKNIEKDIISITPPPQHPSKPSHMDIGMAQGQPHVIPASQHWSKPSHMDIGMAQGQPHVIPASQHCSKPSHMDMGMAQGQPHVIPASQNCSKPSHMDIGMAQGQPHVLPASQQWYKLSHMNSDSSQMMFKPSHRNFDMSQTQFTDAQDVQWFSKPIFEDENSSYNHGPTPLHNQSYASFRAHEEVNRQSPTLTTPQDWQHRNHDISISGMGRQVFDLLHLVVRRNRRRGRNSLAGKNRSHPKKLQFITNGQTVSSHRQVK
ncbi:lpxtg-motif cell wall anchor domain protein [Lasius niger]|uniref:Lpxtg-motif cell wall anchor domain protein n=1 Tax=Lasius niger TaxID=67767 RepID=A0A0J7N510_LASNI|nr:lpxtg-motif cell wall anchor domain protein [Lasius niger]